MVTGESTKDTVKTIAQGRPDDPPGPVVLPRAFFLHADHGCGGHPAFPAPSYNFEGGLFPTPRTFRAARTWTRVFLRRHAPRRRGTQYAAALRLTHNGLWNTGSSGEAGR